MCIEKPRDIYELDDACAVIVINLSNIVCIAAVRAKLDGGPGG